MAEMPDAALPVVESRVLSFDCTVCDGSLYHDT
jgi:hypothetical protein